MNELPTSGDWADYTYVVKENPHRLGDWVIQCCPENRELSVLSRNEELQFMLPSATSHERAQEIRRFLQENLPIVRVANLGG